MTKYIVTATPFLGHVELRDTACQMDHFGNGSVGDACGVAYRRVAIHYPDALRHPDFCIRVTFERRTHGKA